MTWHLRPPPPAPVLPLVLGRPFPQGGKLVPKRTNPPPPSRSRGGREGRPSLDERDWCRAARGPRGSGGPAQPFPPVPTGRACASWVEGREVPRMLGVALGRGSGHWTGRDSRPQGPASWLPGGHPPSPPRLRHHLPAYEDVLVPQPLSSHLLALNVFQGLQQLPSWPRLSPH